MGYYAIVYDIRSTEEEIAGRKAEWSGQLEQMRLQFEKFGSDLQEIGCGKLVDAICCYIEEVHLYLLDQFDILLTELYEQIICYAEGFYDIEDDVKSGEIAQTSLEEQKNILRDEKEYFLDETDRLEGYLQEIGGLIGMEAPSTNGVERGFEILTDMAETLRTEIGEYENSHLNSDFELMESMMEELKNLIANLSGKSKVELTEFKSNDILNCSEVARLGEIGQAIKSQKVGDTKREELVEAYVKRIEETKDWEDCVDDFMDTTFGEIYNIVCTAGNAFLIELTVGKLIYDKNVRKISYEESLSESWEFAKGYNQSIIKVAGETIEGVINLPGTMVSLVGQIQKNGLVETGGNIVDSVVSSVSEIVVEDIIYGDARSRGEAAGRIVIAVADSVVGGTAMKAAKDAKKAAKAAKNAAKVVENVEDAAQTAKKIDKVIEEIAEIVDDIKGGTHVLPNAEDLKMSQTVQNHMNDVIKKGPNAGQLSRPYIDSDGTTLLLKEIMESADPVPDTILQSGLRWDVSGTFRGSTGTWELVVDTSTNTVVHFNFVAQ